MLVPIHQSTHCHNPEVHNLSKLLSCDIGDNAIIIPFCTYV